MAALVVLAAAGCSSADDAATHAPTSGTGAAGPTTTTFAPAGSPDQVRPPADARQAIDALVRVERGLRTDDRDPTRLDRLGWEQQKVYGTLLVHPDWQAGGLAGLPADVRAIAQATSTRATP